MQCQREQRPPVGISPKTIWIIQRVQDLQEAIKRYMESDLPVPIQWVEEYNEHLEKVNAK